MEPHVALPEQVLVSPQHPCGTGVLVLSGSSGRLDADRAALLASWGATALAIRWFGGAGQQPDTFEVPLELFFAALDVLADSCDHLAVVGTSFGAEAALLIGVHDQRVGAIVAVAPTPVVWAGVAPGEGNEGSRQTSHWTLGGAPLPFVPIAEDWEPDHDPPAFRGLYAHSLEASPERAVAAAIPVEQIRGDVVLVGGGDDQVWPSAEFAMMLAARRADHGAPSIVLTHPDAGHRVRFPSEPAVASGARMARGGSPRADAELGRQAWPFVAAALRLNSEPAIGEGTPPD